MRNFKFFYFLFFIFFYCSAHSENQNLVFHGAYTFETYPGQKACAVYVSIFNNTKKKFTINSLESDIAGKAEIHEVILKDDIVSMKRVEKLIISSKEQVYFQPGGNHIMLMNLKRELVDGSYFFINFKMDDGSTNKVKVMVLNKKLRENFIE